MRRLWPLGFGIGLLLVVATQAHALDPTRRLTQYGHSVWKVGTGPLSGLPLEITQSADGYIWLGTRNGLLRFDGVRFVRWPQNIEPPTNAVLALYAGRDGSLWIGSEGGIGRWRDGRLTDIPNARGPVRAIAETPDGTIWFARSPADAGGPLCQIVGATGVRCFGKSDGLADSQLTSLIVDRAGDLWAGGERTLAHGRPGRFHVDRPPTLANNSNSAGIAAIALGADDSVFVGTPIPGPLSLQKVVGDVWAPVAGTSDAPALTVNALLMDSNGALWIGTANQGIFRLRGDVMEHVGTAEGLSGDQVLRLYEDRDHTIWVVTTEGVDQFRDLRVATYSRREGLGSAEVDGVLASRDGTVWVGGSYSLDAIANGQIRSIQTGRGLPGTQVTSLLEDRAGRLWIGLDSFLTLYRDGRFHRVDLPDGRMVGMVTSLTEDRDGDVWAVVAGPPRTLLRIRDGQVRESLTAPLVPAMRRVAAAPDGSLWLGLVDGNLARWRNGKSEMVPFRPAHPPRTVTLINQVIVRPDGAVLGATAFGLIGWKDGARRTMTVANGLPCNQIFALVDDAAGNEWLYAECGLIEIPRDQMRAWWDDPALAVRPRVLGRLDGALPAWSPFQSAARSRDGRLWFANNIALQVVDPARLVNESSAPPPVHVEEIVADRASYALGPDPSLPPLTRDVQIAYTAPSFAAPEGVRFRYKLEGHDRNWVDAGPRRVAFYNDLPPGRYRFRVIAANHDSAWNEAGAQISFAIAHAWYQTMWFRLAIVSLAIAGLAAVYRLRVRHVAAALAVRFDDRLRERTRLAQDLHDSLLQHIQASKMVLDCYLRRGTDAQEMRTAADRAAVWLDQAVQEGRDVLNSLRTSNHGPGVLPAMLQRHAASVADLNQTMAISFRIAGRQRELHPVVIDEVASIGGEAMRNACVHSGGRRLDVDLVYDANLTLRVRDDGAGIDPVVVTHGREGHFGLRGMRERATALGGTLTVDGAKPAGTEVTLVVPGSLVFEQGAPPLHSTF